MLRRYPLVGILFAALLLAGIFLKPIAVEAAAQEPALPYDINHHWAYDNLADFLQSGLLSGSAKDGKLLVRPNDPVTRAEYAALLTRALELAAPASGQPVPTYADVHPGDWYYSPVRIAALNGIATGIKAGTFGPDRDISRAEAAVMIVRAFRGRLSSDAGKAPVFQDIAGHWAQDDIIAAAQAGLVSGLAPGKFGPSQGCTRAEAVTMIRRALLREASQLPADQTLIDAARDTWTAEIPLIEQHKYDELHSLIEQRMSGFMGIIEAESVKALEALADAGAELHTSVSGTPTGWVLYKSDRYAAVRLSGADQIATVGSGDQATTQATAIDDTYYLHKTSHGWTVYGTKDRYHHLMQLYFQNVYQMIDPDTSYLQMQVGSAVMHPSKPVLYLVDETGNSIIRRNADTGASLAYPIAKGHVEKLFATEHHLFAAVSVRPHDPYWWDGEQEGLVLEFDPDTLRLTGTIQTAIDPFDLVAEETDTGTYVYVSSGSGQWSTIDSYNADTHERLDHKMIRQLSYLTIDPVKHFVYAVDSDSVPRSITFFAAEDGRFTQAYDAPGLGDYPLTTYLQMSPDGKYLFNGSGHYFQSTIGRDTNMRHIADLRHPINGMAFAIHANRLYAASGTEIIVYAYNTLHPVIVWNMDEDVKAVFYRNQKLYILSDVSGSMPEFAVESLFVG